MRRSTRLSLVVGVPLLAAFAAYTGYWWITADRIRQGVANWAEAMRARRIEASWRQVRVAGFPFAFRVELNDATVRDLALTPTPELHLPMLSGSTAPWDFRKWRLAAPEGLEAGLAGAGQRPPGRLTATAASGTVAVDPQGGATIWLTLERPMAEAGERVRAQSADGWVVLPARPPQTHDQTNLAVALRLNRVTLPASPPPLSDTVDELALGLKVMGPFPGGALPQALAAWRDAGGTVELDNFHLRWGALGISGSGTLALDLELQPIGGFSGAVQGYDQIMTALVESGRLRASDAGLARLGLSMMARAGPDGRSEIKTSFTVQHGEMLLGPLKLGKVPRVAWE
ncbi:MAG: DUF2125 domain-containing protein [Alphaproteobacteria bacterium]|nr:DUF2125 domain-containing protein [Alphaproteobacteria bacterium]